MPAKPKAAAARNSTATIGSELGCGLPQAGTIHCGVLFN
jgi:hypothetical protein